jgi:hypothetical protein
MLPGSFRRAYQRRFPLNAASELAIVRKTKIASTNAKK